MPQPFQTGIDRHQRCHDLHPVMTGTTGVHFPGDLVQVIAHAGKLTQQRRRNRGSLPARVGFSSRSGAGRARGAQRVSSHRQRLARSPTRQLFSVAPLKQPPVFVFRHPHREHLVAFICQNRLLITP
jgi:hypothetical protein